MGILLAYFAFVASTLAVIMTAWIGVADSGVARLHLQHASAIQHSYDASVMADNAADARPAPAAAVKTAAKTAAKTLAPRHSERHAAARVLNRHPYDPRVAWRLNPPTDDGH
jgi:hypothetical protein